ncbi:MAG: class I SAM-dependent methyltransferase [Clostridiales bacterium]|nr:class I SAM-dependent methyltransferase [Clostridiales bacterium]
MNANNVVKKIQRFILKMHKWENSTDYWERRYNMGCDSGAGSYNRLALFKAEIINDFVKQNSINSVIEWGCGDGNQLKLARYQEYVGIDVSHKAVEICKALFRNDNSKKFYCNNNGELPQNVFGGGREYDLALSLDVIYHLVEDDIFEKYMKQLFLSSSKYVCIYSCNFDKKHEQHVRCRKFTDYIEKNEPDWELIKKVPNRFPYDSKDRENTSWSDFYFYEKVIKC